MTNISVSQPILSSGPDAAPLDHLSMLARVRLDAGQTGGALGLVEERASRGACTPTHRHDREAETFVVLDGVLEGWADGSLSRVGAGEVLHLPAGIPHAFRVVSQTAHFLVVVTPGGFERFFTAVGRPYPGAFEDTPPEPGPPPTAEQVASLAGVLAPLGVEITGPPPF